MAEPRVVLMSLTEGELRSLSEGLDEAITSKSVMIEQLHNLETGSGERVAGTYRRILKDLVVIKERCEGLLRQLDEETIVPHEKTVL